MKTKRIGDYDQQRGIAVALRLAATPIVAVHAAVATEKLLVREHHGTDVAGWSELVTGLPRPLIQDGYIKVSDTPGLGFGDIDEDVMRTFRDPQHPDFCTPSTDWDGEPSTDRLWS